jgi:hypothetical protein
MPGTIKTRFNDVRSVLRAAVRGSGHAVDPSERVTLPRSGAQRITGNA